MADVVRSEQGWIECVAAYALTPQKWCTSAADYGTGPPVTVKGMEIVFRDTTCVWGNTWAEKYGTKYNRKLLLYAWTLLHFSADVHWWPPLEHCILHYMDFWSTCCNIFGKVLLQIEIFGLEFVCCKVLFSLWYVIPKKAYQRTKTKTKKKPKQNNLALLHVFFAVLFLFFFIKIN